MAKLSTRTARKALRARGAPYWTKLGEGRSLGYLATPNGRPGRWQVRVFSSDATTSSGYMFSALGVADDLPHVEADGKEILTYQQALAAATDWDPYDAPEDEDDVDDAEGEGAGRYPAGTVGAVVEGYLRWYAMHKRSAERTRYVMEAHVLPELGEVPLDRLKANRIRRWHERLAAKPAHVRTSSKRKKKRQTRKATTEDEKRARKVTANRALSILKAALHRKWLHGRAGRVLGSWSEVSPFEDVDRARIRYLNADEAQRLVNACPPDFRALVLGALYTGARFGELTRLGCRDMRPEAQGVYIEQTKSGKPRTIFLNDEGMTFFEGLTAGRPSDGYVFVHADGGDWKKNHQQRPMKAACKVAKIDPPVVFHELRHSYASMYLMSGGGLVDLARQLGHSSTRMVEKHYGHLSDDWRAEQARKHAPSLGIEPGKVRRMRRSAGGR